MKTSIRLNILKRYLLQTAKPDIEKIKSKRIHFLELVKVCDNRIANIKKKNLAAEKTDL